MTAHSVISSLMKTLRDDDYLGGSGVSKLVFVNALIVCEMGICMCVSVLCGRF